MTDLILITPINLALACAVAVLAGLVKGMVGFAMPMIMVSGLSLILPPDVALAGLILPTLVTNSMQAFWQGPRAAIMTVKRFRVFLSVGLICLLVSAQLVVRIPVSTFLVMIGAPVCFFAIIQLLGVTLTLKRDTARSQATAGAVAGFIGGMSGVWGPPTVAYLTALNTPKRDQIRIQGVIYGLGALALLGAHIGSGILRKDTVGLSFALVVPAVLGMWMGMKFHDRIDQATFRKATLLVLLVAGFNLLRRGLTG